jgi:hypothetical protein
VWRSRALFFDIVLVLICAFPGAPKTWRLRLWLVAAIPLAKIGLSIAQFRSIPPNTGQFRLIPPSKNKNWQATARNSRIPAKKKACCRKGTGKERIDNNLQLSTT